MGEIQKRHQKEEKKKEKNEKNRTAISLLNISVLKKFSLFLLNLYSWFWTIFIVGVYLFHSVNIYSIDLANPLNFVSSAT